MGPGRKSFKITYTGASSKSLHVIIIARRLLTLELADKLRGFIELHHSDWGIAISFDVPVTGAKSSVNRAMADLEKFTAFARRVETQNPLQARVNEARANRLKVKPPGMEIEPASERTGAYPWPVQGSKARVRFFYWLLRFFYRYGEQDTRGDADFWIADDYLFYGREIVSIDNLAILNRRRIAAIHRKLLRSHPNWTVQLELGVEVHGSKHVPRILIPE